MGIGGLQASGEYQYESDVRISTEKPPKPPVARCEMHELGETCLSPSFL